MGRKEDLLMEEKWKFLMAIFMVLGVIGVTAMGLWRSLRKTHYEKIPKKELTHELTAYVAYRIYLAYCKKKQACPINGLELYKLILGLVGQAKSRYGWDNRNKLIKQLQNEILRQRRLKEGFGRLIKYSGEKILIDCLLWNISQRTGELTVGQQCLLRRRIENKVTMVEKSARNGSFFLDLLADSLSYARELLGEGTCKLNKKVKSVPTTSYETQSDSESFSDKELNRWGLFAKIGRKSSPEEIALQQPTAAFFKT